MARRKMTRSRRLVEPLSFDDLVARLDSHRFVSDPVDPPTFPLMPGQPIEVGNLVGCEVVETRLDGRAVIVRHHPQPSRECPCPPEWAYNAWWWFDVLPVTGESRPRRLSVDPFLSSPSNTQLGSLIDRGLYKQLSASPEFQRDYVWTRDDDRRLIASLFAGIEIGRFIFVRWPYPRNKYDVIDGKQRLRALCDFVCGRFEYEGRTWQTLHPRDRNAVNNCTVPLIDLRGDELRRSDLLRIFLAVNAAGVPQTEEHLARVRKLYEEALVEEGKEVDRA